MGRFLKRCSFKSFTLMLSLNMEEFSCAKPIIIILSNFNLRGGKIIVLELEVLMARATARILANHIICSIHCIIL